MEDPDVTVALIEGEEHEHRAAAVRELIALNEARAGQSAQRSPICALLRNDTGAVSGGLWGEVRWRWLTVGTLFVPEQLRGNGIGRRLMLEVEEAARRRGCIGSFTDTYSFQAQSFYEHLGYAVFGEIEDYPPGHRRCFLSKRFA